MQSLQANLSPSEMHSLRRRAAAVLELRRRVRVEKSSRNTRIGFVCPKEGHTHTIHKVNGKWTKTKLDADLYLAAKLERAGL